MVPRRVPVKINPLLPKSRGVSIFHVTLEAETFSPPRASELKHVRESDSGKIRAAARVKEPYMIMLMNKIEH